MKEHIKALTRIKENYERLWKENLAKEEDVKEEYDAICAGITALEAEPCEDCVNRQAAINDLSQSWTMTDRQDIRIGYEIAIEILKKLPPVTPILKKEAESEDTKCR